MFSFFFFNDTATTEIYTLSLHDALPICQGHKFFRGASAHEVSAYFELIGAVLQEGIAAGEIRSDVPVKVATKILFGAMDRSEEHTSELQSRLHLVCRLLLEKKKRKDYTH